MAGSRNVRKNYKSTACSRKRTACSTYFLPEAIIFNILVRLPADILYNVMRYVCREWYNIINGPAFVDAQLLHSTRGFLYQTHPMITIIKTHYVELGKSTAHIREFGFQFRGPIQASLDGLLVLCDLEAPRGTGLFYMANPVTNQQVALPPVLLPRELPFETISRCGLAYVPSTREYKVANVRVHMSKKYDPICFVLTVAPDNVWRRIKLKYRSYMVRCLLAKRPFCVGAFLFWANSSFRYFIALDMQTETFHRIGKPTGFEGNRVRFSIMGGFLIMMDSADATGSQWRVWALTEPKLGRWAKLLEIDLSLHFGQMHLGSTSIRAGLWANNDEVLIFGMSPTQIAIAYDVKTKESFNYCNLSELFPEPQFKFTSTFVSFEFRSSLVSLKKMTR